MKGEGIVVKATGLTATVRIERKSACSGECSSCGMCENPVFDVDVQNKIGAKTGDKVKLYMPSKKVYMSAFLVYLLPILVIFAVMGVCSLIQAKGYVTAAWVLIAVVIWIAVIRKYNKSANLKSEIVEIIGR